MFIPVSQPVSSTQRLGELCSCWLKPGSDVSCRGGSCPHLQIPSAWPQSPKWRARISGLGLVESSSSPQSPSSLCVASRRGRRHFRREPGLGWQVTPTSEERSWAAVGAGRVPGPLGTSLKAVTLNSAPILATETVRVAVHAHVCSEHMYV